MNGRPGRLLIDGPRHRNPIEHAAAGVQTFTAGQLITRKSFAVEVSEALPAPATPAARRTPLPNAEPSPRPLRSPPPTSALEQQQDCSASAVKAAFGLTFVFGAGKFFAFLTLRDVGARR